MPVISAFLYWDGKQQKENAWKLVGHLACCTQQWTTRDLLWKKVREDCHLTLCSALQKIYSSRQAPAVKHKCAPRQAYTYVSYTHIMHRHVYKLYKILAKATFFYSKHRTALHTRLVMKRREWRQIHKEVLKETCIPYVWYAKNGNWSIFLWVTIY